MESAAARKIRCRAAMVNYVLQELRGALSPATECPPGYQLALADKQSLDQWLFESV
jgi:hypothetical protein